jgi:Thioesterase superfamily
MNTQEMSSQADFRERAKTNDVPIARLIGFEAKDIADGRATVVLAAGPQHANPMGTLHGGVLCDIADAAMGIAFASTLGPDESFTTVELKINFFRPVWRRNSKRKERSCGGAKRSATSSAPLPTRKAGWLRKQLLRAWFFATRRPQDGNSLNCPRFFEAANSPYRSLRYA